MMNDGRIVFAGPSLHGVDPRMLEGFEIRPPAACGDILSAALSGARVIALIDGVFENSAAVWHKEILYALSADITVFGAASMGALRASECAAFGMIGVGTIYLEYARGARVADSDVAVVHAPAELGYLPLTVALVDAEATIARVRERGAGSEFICDRLLAAARSLPFARRSWPNVISEAHLNAKDSLLATAAIERNELSVKGKDAKLLLETLRNVSFGARRSTTKPWKFERTAFFDTLKSRVAPPRPEARFP